jgi:hypothetical protein
MNINRNYTNYNPFTKTSLVGKELGVNNVAFNTINFNGSSDTIDSDGEDSYNVMRGSFFIDPNNLLYGSTDTLFIFPTLAEEGIGGQQRNACLRLKLVISDFSGGNALDNASITKSVIYNIVASSSNNNTNEPFYSYTYDLPTTDLNDQYNTVSSISPPLLEFVSTNNNFISWDNTNKRFLMRLILDSNNENHIIRGIYTIM